VKPPRTTPLASLKGWGLTDPRLEAWDFNRGWTLEIDHRDDRTAIYTADQFIPKREVGVDVRRRIVATPVFIGNKTADLEDEGAGSRRAIVARASRYRIHTNA